MSNELPDISSKKADQRRVILCEFADRTEPDIPDPDFEERLWQEAGAFLSNCLDMYRRDYPRHGDIATDTTGAESLADENELQYEALLDCFIYEQVTEGTPEYETAKTTWLTGAEIRKKLLTTRAQEYVIKQFFGWLRRSKGVRRISIRRNGAVTHVYRYLRDRPVLTGWDDR